MRRFNGMDGFALILAIIGAINWGLIGLFRYNLIDAIFGPMSAISRIIYTLVGVSGLYLIFTAGKIGQRATDEYHRYTEHHPAT